MGKTTITRALERRLGGVFSVSATTRPRAEGEVDGRDYCFRSDFEFQQLADDGAFLEQAQVYGEYRYGTPREPVERQVAAGKLVILDIDVQGARQVKQAM
ncbi:MAG: guanylate kinase, partial [Phycisphaerales bacterium]